MVTEDRSVVAWGKMDGRGGQAELQKCTGKLLGVINMFILLIVVIVLGVHAYIKMY